MAVAARPRPLARMAKPAVSGSLAAAASMASMGQRRRFPGSRSSRAEGPPGAPGGDFDAVAVVPHPAGQFQLPRQAPDVGGESPPLDEAADAGCAG